MPSDAANERTLLSGSAENTTTAAGDVTANFLAVVPLETLEDIQRNWKWILFIGCLNILIGFACLCFPIFATQTAVYTLTYMILFLGVFSAILSCYSEDGGARNQMLALGLVQILLAMFMSLYPFFTMTLLTFLVASTFMMVGVLQASLAKTSPTLAGRGLAYFQGFLAILMSFFIVLFMPITQWYTIGVLMGMNLLNIGVARILLGMYGRSLSTSDEQWMSPESWRNLLETEW